SQNLLEKLECRNINPTNILDLGCGTGKNGLHFLKKFKKISLVNFDLSENMLEQARKKLTTSSINFLNNSTNFHVCGDMENLPFKDNLFDLVWSSSAIQWSDNLPIVLKHINRILKPSGFFIFSTFGPETLKELRMINDVLYNHPKTNNFLDLKDIRDFLALEGFENSSFDVKSYRLDYANVEDILYDIKGVGATNGNKNRSKGLRGREFINIMKQHYEKYREGELYPATYEVIYAVVSKKNYKN
ncbi:MAG: malonyl-ACP O-methyltransferase BioC, partial [Alphaproteobacteria bacterium]